MNRNKLIDRVRHLGKAPKHRTVEAEHTTLDPDSLLGRARVTVRRRYGTHT